MPLLDAPEFTVKTAAMLNQRDVGKRIWFYGGWWYIKLIYHGTRTSVKIGPNTIGRPTSTWRLEPSTEVRVEKRV